jgi:hypothetical protein
MSRLKASIRAVLDEVRSRPSVYERLLYWSYGPKFRRWCKYYPCTELANRTLLKLKTNYILIFDEFSSYLHEYRNYADLTMAYQRTFAPLCRARDWVHVALTAT